MAFWPRRHFAEILVSVHLTVGVLGVIGLLVAAGLSGNLLFAVMAMVVLVVLLINLVAVWPRPRRRLQRWLLPLAILA
ncbi:MAG: hypothetical protein M1396_01120, partial [Chloroflexi bacterium]|nr:hypothetical protein [Chloroflexota bacterium]